MFIFMARLLSFRYSFLFSAQIPQLILGRVLTMAQFGPFSNVERSCHAHGTLCLTAFERVIEFQLPDPALFLPDTSRNTLRLVHANA
jgi:hypothetical protein